MNINEVSEQLNIKEVSAVERYLYALVQRYIDQETDNQFGNKDAIITEAVRRFKEEINLDSSGVISINGKCGIVIITAEDLQCEPAIKKKSGFNKDIGTTAGTICAGNDERLSDARQPIAHEHTIKQVAGLEGLLNTLTQTMETLGNIHKHDNLTTLNQIEYTGKSEKVDLKLMEDNNHLIQNLKTGMQTMQSNLTMTLTEKVNEINGYIETVNQMIQYLEAMDPELKDSFVSEVVARVQEQLDFSSITGDLNELMEDFNTMVKLQKEIIDSRTTLSRNNESIAKCIRILASKTDLSDEQKEEIDDLMASLSYIHQII